MAGRRYLLSHSLLLRCTTSSDCHKSCCACCVCSTPRHGPATRPGDNFQEPNLLSPWKIAPWLTFYPLYFFFLPARALGFFSQAHFSQSQGRAGRAGNDLPHQCHRSPARGTGVPRPAAPDVTQNSLGITLGISEYNPWLTPPLPYRGKALSSTDQSCALQNGSKMRRTES